MVHLLHLLRLRLDDLLLWHLHDRLILLLLLLLAWSDLLELLHQLLLRWRLLLLLLLLRRLLLLLLLSNVCHRQNNAELRTIGSGYLYKLQRGSSRHAVGDLLCKCLNKQTGSSL